ncbi:MAG TPA: gluconokinase [Thermodesulfobacteriota bacterium]|nr:gluconokinase [Thermodesulfobacteriota bacterium]
MPPARSPLAVSPGDAEDPLVLSLDVGTSSVRAALFDRLGRPLRGMESREKNEIRVTPGGGAEADADVLLERVFACIDGLLNFAGKVKSRIAAVAACTFVNNILGIDGNGAAVAPLTTYADTRSEGEIAGLVSEFDETRVHDRTGCRFHPSYLPARLRWMAKANPGLFRKTERWVSLGEYLELKLFGETSVSCSVASWTGLLDRFRVDWDEEMLGAIPLRSGQLSPLTDVDRPRRGLKFGFERRWPELANVPWFPAVGDGAAANIGSGCFSSGQVAVTMGTTSALRVVLDTPAAHLPAGLWCYLVDRRRSLLGGALSEGGSVYAWMTSVLNGSPEMESAAAAMEPDAHGLTVLPFLAGERAPGWAGHARGAIAGISLATGPQHILRAGMEAVAYRLALVFRLLSPMIPAQAQVIASGGALLNSPLWIRIVTDVLGRPVALSAVEEATARGAALLALEALGEIKLEDVPFTGKMHAPDMSSHARYLRAIERQEELYRKIV